MPAHDLSRRHVLCALLAVLFDWLRPPAVAATLAKPPATPSPPLALPAPLSAATFTYDAQGYLLSVGDNLWIPLPGPGYAENLHEVTTYTYDCSPPA